MTARIVAGRAEICVASITASLRNAYYVMTRTNVSEYDPATQNSRETHVNAGRDRRGIDALACAIGSPRRFPGLACAASSFPLSSAPTRVYESHN